MNPFDFNEKGGNRMPGRRLFAFLLALSLILGCGPSLSQETAEELIISRTEMPGLTPDSFAAWPSLAYASGRTDERLDRINRLIYDGSGMTSYLSVLFMPGGSAGFKADYEALIENGLYAVRLTAEGRMPRGLPAQHHYPFLVSLENGKALTPDELFSDPESARESLHVYLRDSVLPEASAFMDSSGFFPIPLERFTISHDTVLFDYEPEQLTFLSGGAASVSFTLEELANITGEGDQLRRFASMPFSPDEKTSERIFSDLSQGLFPGLYLSLTQPAGLSVPVSQVLSFGPRELDDTVYPEGYAVQTENPFLRDILVITDRAGVQTVGYLARRGNLYGLAIGRLKRGDCLQALGEPAVSIPLDEKTARERLLSPGVMDVYEVSRADGSIVTLSLIFAENETLTSALALAGRPQEDIH